MNDTLTIVVFKLDGQRYAVPLAVVERVVQVAEITPLPNASQTILGAINVHGQVMVVLDLRRHLGLRPRELALSDELLIVRSAQRIVALLVDEVTGVLECPRAAQNVAEQIGPGMENVACVVKQPEGLLLVHNLDRLLGQSPPCTADISLSIQEMTP
jgi:purine-binding chemotaxis protein CheW